MLLRIRASQKIFRLLNFRFLSNEAQTRRVA